jgi:hypothetical protein
MHKSDQEKAEIINLEIKELRLQLAAAQTARAGYQGELERATRTLEHAGYTDTGGTMWQPPLGAAWASDTEGLLMNKMWNLIHEAARKGFVLTIDLVPLKPLAMGHYNMRPDVRPARVRAEPIDRNPKPDPEPFVMVLHPDTREVEALFNGVDIDKAHNVEQVHLRREDGTLSGMVITKRTEGDHG